MPQLIAATWADVLGSSNDGLDPLSQPLWFFSRYRSGRADQLSNYLQTVTFVSAGKEAVVTDPHQARGQHMLQESLNQLFSRQCHYFTPVTITAITISHSHFSFPTVDQPVVCYGHPVGVATEIVQQLRGTRERPFGIDYPRLFKESVDQLPTTPDSLKRRR